MKSSLRILLLASIAILGSACDKSGLYPLFAKTDVLVPCGVDATTWVRSTATGTEILILGAADPTLATTATEVRCYSHGFIEHDSSTHYESGSYSVSSGGQGTATYAIVYDFNYTSTGAVLSRPGAQRQDLVRPRTSSLQLALASGKLNATVDGVAGTYTNLFDLIGSVEKLSLIDENDRPTAQGLDCTWFHSQWHFDFFE